MSSDVFDLLVVSPDFIQATEIEDTAKLHGLTARTCSSSGDALAVLEQATARRVILDLQMPEFDPVVFMGGIQKLDPQPEVIAFGPHVRPELLAAARTAGIERVLTRGQFFMNLVAVLSEPKTRQ